METGAAAVTQLALNPAQSHVFAAGDTRGRITFFSLLRPERPLCRIDCGASNASSTTLQQNAAFNATSNAGLMREGAVLAMVWTSLGHSLVSSHDDRLLRLWGRGAPGGIIGGRLNSLALSEIEEVRLDAIALSAGNAQQTAGAGAAAASSAVLTMHPLSAVQVRQAGMPLQTEVEAAAAGKGLWTNDAAAAESKAQPPPHSQTAAAAAPALLSMLASGGGGGGAAVSPQGGAGASQGSSGFSAENLSPASRAAFGAFSEQAPLVGGAADPALLPAIDKRLLLRRPKTPSVETTSPNTAAVKAPLSFLRGAEEAARFTPATQTFSTS